MDIRILECRKFSSPHTKTGNRIIKDYEIDLEIGEPRTVIIDGAPHLIQRGNVCVRKPGQTVHGKGTQNTVLLTLDFSGRQQAKNYSRNIPGPQQALCDDPLLENLGGVIVRGCSQCCIGCSMCAKICEQKAITIDRNLAVIDYDKCVGCGLCATVCPKKLIVSTVELAAEVPVQ